MSYQALYRVWRPQNFDQLVGQGMIAETLKNAIKNEQLSHAYLFTGPRGTGKTSAAKILSKAVNCQNQVDGNPCNECELCVGITAGQVSDVIEIDAASNNGVEEIRDLRDKVRYAPTQASYKVYIIDEVHMLTTGAFNALLKTLEEPPAQVLFILATTEPHKIPATIMSRTQRFDFQRLKDHDITTHMAHILDEYQVDFEDEALAIIARASNGGMRDSLSLLDQALSFNNEELTTQTALQVSGSFDQITYVKYILALYQREIEAALTILDEQLQSGKQASRFIEELILFSRDVLLTMHSSANKTLLSDGELQPLRESVPGSFYYTLINGLNEAQQQMRFTNQPDLYLEVMTVQLVEQPDLAITTGSGVGAGSAAAVGVEVGGGGEVVQTLQQRISELEEQMAQMYQQLKGTQQQLERLNDQKNERVSVAPLNEGDVVGDSSSGPGPVAGAESATGIESASTAKQEEPLTPRRRPQAPQVAYRLRLQAVYDVLNIATRQHIIAIKQQWTVILNELSPQHRAKLMGTQPLAAGPNLVLISFDNEQMCGLVQNDAMLKQLLENLASEKLGESTKLAFILSREWQKVRQNYKILHDRNGGQAVVLEGSADEEDEPSDESDVEVRHEASPESHPLMAGPAETISPTDPVNSASANASSDSESNSAATSGNQTQSQDRAVPTMRDITQNIVQAAQTAHDREHAETAVDQFVDPSLEASDPEASMQREYENLSPQSPQVAHEEDTDNEVALSETEEVPPIISKALELFGERANIIHEEAPTNE